MSGFNWKGGWHPEGKGGNKKESWRGDFKGVNSVAKLMGKGKDSSEQEEREAHVSRPLNTLKDPSLFAPPPRHIAYHGAAAAPHTTTPDTRGWGAPLPEDTIRQQEQAAEAARRAAEEEEEKPPPGPYRADTTGLSTANLPKPPVRRADGASPAPSNSSAAGGPPKPAPRLPPRLPPRQHSRPDVHTPEPPPAYHDAAQYQPPNPSAINRLGQAGVSVPGFDIGRTASPPQPPVRSSQPTPPGAPQAAQVNELQSRFAKMTAQSSSPSEPQAQSQGTTWAQKQSAMNTANNLHKDPSSVSLSDARGAASTANSFRERHGESVKSGMQQGKAMSQKYGQQAKDMNEKYGISNKLGGYAASAKNFNRSAPSAGASSYAPSAPSPSPSSAPGLAPASAGKKAPPPPPPKKRELAAPPASSASPPPPPLPLASKPR